MTSLYIVFEGIIRTGKSTHARRLKEFLKKKYPDKKIILTYEPGGTEIADDIRELVQGKAFRETMEPVCEAYLYAAARAQSLRKVVMPALEKGSIVISDRSYLSSCSYQGGSKKLGIETIYEINKTALSGLTPDLVIFIDLHPEISLGRNLDEEGDKHEKESIEFFQKARETYLELSKRPELKEKWKTIDGSGSIEEVYQKVQKAVNNFLHHHEL